MLGKQRVNEAENKDEKKAGEGVNAEAPLEAGAAQAPETPAEGTATSAPEGEEAAKAPEAEDKPAEGAETKVEPEAAKAPETTKAPETPVKEGEAKDTKKEYAVDKHKFLFTKSVKFYHGNTLIEKRIGETMMVSKELLKILVDSNKGREVI